MDLPWDRLDVATYSWQKCLGGEAAHGVLVLGPRAVERLESHMPAWPLPKVFRLTRRGSLIEGVYAGATINTPSLLCVADQLDALAWARRMGGVSGLRDRARANLAVLAEWVDRSEGVEFLAADPRTRSWTSVCLKLTAPWFLERDPDEQRASIADFAALLADEGAAYDIAGYREAPPGLRIWTGPTVERDDVAALTPWLDWAMTSMR
jgi:phosphoserine aminotransferase